ncbi:MAG: pilus assembly protein [Pseudomonadales bacterium]|nr:pilus assembly protein [Pseudomonadales bacterium]
MPEPSYLTRPQRHQGGAVALEFLMLFPLVVAMLYAAATYGVLFFSKYRMQNAADQAVASVLRLDRNQYPEADLGTAMINRSSAALGSLLAELPTALTDGLDDSVTLCALTQSGTVDLLKCTVRVNNEEHPIVPRMSFGFLGTFPPMPATITVESVLAI